MTRPGRSAVVIAAVAVGWIVFLAATTPPAPRLLIPEDVYALPTVAEVPWVCRDVALEGAILAGHHDIKHASVWLESQGQRIEVVFPPGYEALFSDGLEILDATGQTVARGGDAIQGGCTTGPDAQGPVLILSRPAGT